MALALEADPTPGTTNIERCIPINRIKQTKIVDDQTILFYMTNGKIYSNHLPRRCPTLAVATGFKYDTSQRRLCSVDAITVLNQISGNVTHGAACGLGQFELSTALLSD